MINWAKGITARYYGMILDPYTWKTVTTFDITSGTIKYSNSGIYESADFSSDQFNQDDEYWIRLYLDARQDDGSELVPLFTGIANSPDDSYNGRRKTGNIQCYSVLSSAERVLLPLGYYILSGTNGAVAIRDLLKEVIPAPIIIDGESPSITSTIISESDENYLSMVSKILHAINWRFRIDGNGTVHICPLADSISASFDSLNNDVIGLDVSIKKNLYDVPNVFRAVSDGLMAIARDEDPNSRFSIQNRGREIWFSESNCNLNSNEKIGEYAERRLKEEQTVFQTISYNRRFDPNVKPSDLIYIRYPEQKISGLFEVESQSITLGHGAEVSEESFGSA